jgi:ubiquinone biosynthesis protein
VSGHQARYRQIAGALSRHGLGYLVDVLGLERWMPFEWRVFGHQRRDEPYTRPEHVRLALEDLGATFVKLGQIVSTRSDLLPPPFQRELTKLQDAAPPVPPAAIRAAVTEELGRAPEEVFAHFDYIPLASASIGQAHAATLPDGTEVVLKVRRPGVVEVVEADLEIIRNLAVRASRRWPAAAEYDVVGLAADFADTLRAELDYLREGHNAERFAANFAADLDVHIPRVFWEMTTSRVITLERLNGIKVSDLEALDEARIDRRALAERATRVAADMVFDHGFFHADPHPGNLFIEPDGRIAILDYGMVGELDERTRERLAGLLVAFARRDPDTVTAAILEIGVARGRVEPAALSADVTALLDRYEGLSLGEIKIGAVVGDVLEIFRRHHLVLPRELALVLKTIVMMEGMGAHLDPDFQLAEVMGPYAQRLMARHLDPTAIALNVAKAGLEAARLSVELPDRVRRLLDELEGGGLRAQDLQPLVVRLERASARLVVGVIAAAVIEGLAELVAADPERWRRHTPKLLAIGSIAAMSGYLAWSARGHEYDGRAGRAAPIT